MALHLEAIQGFHPDLHLPNPLAPLATRIEAHRVAHQAAQNFTHRQEDATETAIAFLEGNDIPEVPVVEHISPDDDTAPDVFVDDDGTVVLANTIINHPAKRDITPDALVRWTKRNELKDTLGHTVQVEGSVIYDKQPLSSPPINGYAGTPNDPSV